MKRQKGTKRGTRQKKSLGQVFLRTDWPCAKIVSRLEQSGVRRALEIGPGGGVLTVALLKAGINVDAVEKDDYFAGRVKDIYEVSKKDDWGQLEVFNQDISTFDMAEWSKGGGAVVGNIPYNVSTKILRQTIPCLGRLSLAAFLVQLEFAQRLAASSGTKAYGSLSVYTQLRADVTMGSKVERTCFNPIPKVDSALIYLKAAKGKAPQEAVLRKVEQISRAMFSMRRKKLRNAIKLFVSPEQLEQVPFDLNRRPETLSPDEYLQLATYMMDQGG